MLDITDDLLNEISKNRSRYYTTHYIKKHNGRGRRRIDAPDNLLKSIQKRILNQILNKFPSHKVSYGFVEGKSPLDNASQHVGAYAILNMDIRNFFNSLTYENVVDTLNFLRISDKYKHLCNYKKEDVNLIADLLTYNGVLAQGSPASPAMSNLIMIPFDDWLSSEISSPGKIKVTRYADDITVSFYEKVDFQKIKTVQFKISRKLNDTYRLRINTKKTSIKRQHQRMVVTGIVVNEKINVKRKEWRNLRAKIHNMLITSKRPSDTELQVLQGQIRWVMTLNPSRGKKFMEQYKKLLLLPN